MENPLTRKLRNYVHLSDTEKLWLADGMSPKRPIEARRDFVFEGDDLRVVNVVLEGWAYRYKQFADGRRQIVSLLLPGDCCDPQIFLLNRMDHTLATATAVVLAQIPAATFRDLLARSPTLDEAFHRETLATLGTQREWIANLGRRSSIERLAHLFCELHARLSAVGLVDGATFAMPLTQVDLADALGQTSVHVNRTLQELRAQGLISLRGRQMRIHDADGLAKLAHFDPTYLHLTQEPARFEQSLS